MTPPPLPCPSPKVVVFLEYASSRLIFEFSIFIAKSSDRSLITPLNVFKVGYEASYPTLNTFKGVIRDRSDDFAMKIENSNINRDEAYSKNTTTLGEGQGSGGGVIYDSGSAN